MFSENTSPKLRNLLKGNAQLKLCRKNVMDSITQVKKWYTKIKQREKCLKVLIKEKELGTDEESKKYILHIQNETIIRYLIKCKGRLESKRTNPMTANIQINDETLNLIINKAKALLSILGKIRIIIKNAEDTKFNNSEYIKTKIFPYKISIDNKTNSIVDLAKELMIEAHTIKTISYLQRELFVKCHPKLFPQERDRNNFIMATYFNSRLTNSSNSKNNIRKT